MVDTPLSRSLINVIILHDIWYPKVPEMYLDKAPEIYFGLGSPSTQLNIE
jgi:hypothetical protein